MKREKINKTKDNITAETVKTVDVKPQPKWQKIWSWIKTFLKIFAFFALYLVTTRWMSKLLVIVIKTPRGQDQLLFAIPLNAILFLIYFRFYWIYEKIYAFLEYCSVRLCKFCGISCVLFILFISCILLKRYFEIVIENLD